MKRSPSRKSDEAARKRYVVVYERDESGYWIASVSGVKGCHTQGRSLSQARERIREALGLFIDDADKVELRDRIKLPGELQGVVTHVRKKGVALAELEAEVRAERRKAVERLVNERHLSRRDAAELIGLSFQRVQQLVRK
jgi:predicted RNase H-like HicB family nuclease